MAATARTTEDVGEMIGRVHTNGLHMHSGPNPGVSGLTWCQPTSVRRVPGAAAQAASPARALRHMMTGTEIFSGGEAIGRRLPRPAHRCSRLPAVLGSSRRSPARCAPSLRCPGPWGQISQIGAPK